MLGKRSMDNRLEKFRTRWYRWLGQKTRIDKSTWVELLDSNWIGWASNVLKKHNINFKEVLWGNSDRYGVKRHFSRAIKCADLRELGILDNLYCTDLINRKG